MVKETGYTFGLHWRVDDFELMKVRTYINLNWQPKLHSKNIHSLVIKNVHNTHHHTINLGIRNKIGCLLNFQFFLRFQSYPTTFTFRVQTDAFHPFHFTIDNIFCTIWPTRARSCATSRRFSGQSWINFGVSCDTQGKLPWGGAGCWHFHPVPIRISKPFKCSNRSNKSLI